MLVTTTTRAHQFAKVDPAWQALCVDATTVCVRHLAQVAGTHALLLDAAIDAGTPSLPGVAHWTRLRSGPDSTGWQGPLCADADALPFGDSSFCAVLVRFAGMAGVAPESIADELSRVLAPHGMLMVADRHPYSLWRTGAVSPGRWERALRAAELDLVPARRCGAPWPRERGAKGVPRWLVRGFGGAWVIEAQRRPLAVIPLRKATPKRRASEQGALVHDARRECA